MQKKWLLVLLLVWGVQIGWADEQTTPAEPAPAAPAPSTTAEVPASASPLSREKFFFDFIDYRYGLHNRVIKRFQNLTRENRDKLLPGKIKLHYFISAQGYVSVIEADKKISEDIAMGNLHKLARYALAQENNDPQPFPAAVLQEYPEGYFYQITLTLK